MTATVEAIRDQALTVVEALVPDVCSGDRFRRYRNEGDGDFEGWAEAHPAAAFRRFQIRDTGDDKPAESTNLDVEWRTVTFRGLFAYPHNSRTGPQQALDRDDAIELDQYTIEDALCARGRANFQGSADACWVADGSSTQRIEGTAVDFLEIVFVMLFRRSMT